jgi:hypothetical protein
MRSAKQQARRTAASVATPVFGTARDSQESGPSALLPAARLTAPIVYRPMERALNSARCRNHGSRSHRAREPSSIERSRGGVSSDRSHSRRRSRFRSADRFRCRQPTHSGPWTSRAPTNRAGTATAHAAGGATGRSAHQGAARAPPGCANDSDVENTSPAIAYR